MDRFLERVVAIRQREEMATFRYRGRKEMLQPIGRLIAGHGEKGPRPPMSACRWCQAPILLGSKDCRACHKKQRPCPECHGPVGRTRREPVCLKCWNTGVNPNKKRGKR